MASSASGETTSPKNVNSEWRPFTLDAVLAGFAVILLHATFAADMTPVCFSRSRAFSGPGETRTLTGTDLNRVPLPIGLRAPPLQPNGRARHLRWCPSNLRGVGGAGPGHHPARHRPGPPLARS